MRLTVIGLILVILSFSTTGCQNGDEPLATAASTLSPQPTPEIVVTFATVTPGSAPGSAVAGDQLLATVLPEQTPTPAATATLVAYIVQAGDTLIGIAAAQGVTLDELLTVNPGLQPELLLVGQEVFLPPRATVQPPPVVVTGTPDFLTVAGLGQYSAATGGLWVLGEVRNSGPQAAELVQVQVSLRSPDDELLVERVIWLTPVTIPTGAQAPFGVRFPNVGPGEAVASAEIVAGRPVYDLGSRYLDLAVVDAEVTIGPNPIIVSGRLENLGQLPAGQISIVTTFYDASGQVTGFTETAVEGVISPGEGHLFLFTALPPGGRAEGYDFAVQATVVE